MGRASAVERLRNPKCISTNAVGRRRVFYFCNTGVFSSCSGRVETRVLLMHSPTSLIRKILSSSTPTHIAVQRDTAVNENTTLVLTAVGNQFRTRHRLWSLSSLWQPPRNRIGRDGTTLSTCPILDSAGLDSSRTSSGRGHNDLQQTPASVTAME